MSRTRGVLSPIQAILLGAAVVGTLDILDAIVFFGQRGVQPIRIPQSIAAGLLGRAAFQGGASTAGLGLGLHYFNAFVIVLVYYLASRRLRLLTARPILCGFAYGLVVYVVMNEIVVPLSAAGKGAFQWPVFVNGIAIHLFGVGLPAALCARAARPAGP